MKKNKLEQTFLNFFKEHSVVRPPFLLGFSGGSDSTALFYLMHQAQIPFHAVYINHGFRPESQKEAQHLANVCKEKHVPFSVCKLAIQENNNLEDRWRKHRLQIYKDLCQKHTLTAVFLGHHADDQAETVLKRILEGATLPKLQGLTSYSVMDGVSLCRPLLNVRKKDVYEWLHAQGISYFEDTSNQDPRFLRSRLRGDLLPLLSERFGKEVVTSLCRLGQAAEELKVFFNELIAQYDAQIQKREESVTLEIAQHMPSPFILKILVKHLFEKQGISVSMHAIQSIIHLVQHAKKATHLSIAKTKVHVQKGRIEIFFSSQNPQNLS